MFWEAKLAERNQIGSSGRKGVGARAFQFPQASCAEHHMFAPGFLIPDH